MLCGVGERLEVLDLSGGLMSTLTDESLSSVVQYCPNLTSLYISMHQYITGASLLPLLREPERAAKLRCLHLSCKLVREINFGVLMVSNVFIAGNVICLLSK